MTRSDASRLCSKLWIGRWLLISPYFDPKTRSKERFDNASCGIFSVCGTNCGGIPIAQSKEGSHDPFTKRCWPARQMITRRALVQAKDLLRPQRPARSLGTAGH
jgi:hypothetical protein